MFICSFLFVLKRADVRLVHGIRARFFFIYELLFFSVLIFLCLVSVFEEDVHEKGKTFLLFLLPLDCLISVLGDQNQPRPVMLRALGSDPITLPKGPFQFC